VVRLKADGSYVSQWGRKGKAESEFAAAHGIAIDSANRIYVADRGNNRVQVFSPDGKFVAAWTDFGNPFGVLVVGDVLLVSDGDVHRISHLRLADGKITAQWGNPELLQLPHLMAVSPQGRLYVAEVNGNRVQIFRRAAAVPSGSAAQ
jgi:DNA-binding beta-propeller fold protein YncE